MINATTRRKQTKDHYPLCTDPLSATEHMSAAIVKVAGSVPVHCDDKWPG